MRYPSLNNNKDDLRNLLILFGSFLATQFLFSIFTSPVFPYSYGDDSAIFSLMGKGVTEGKTLYNDLFDHKGPLIFLINALGHLLGGRMAIFVLQCLCGICAITAMYYCGKLLRPEKRYRSVAECFCIFFAAFAVFIHTMQGGNLTEEYSVPFISIALYFIMKYALNAGKNVQHPPVYAFVYGFCFAFLAFLRLNNALTVAAGVLPIIVFLLYKKEIKNCLLNLLFGLLGVAVVTVPIIIYFYCNEALEGMIGAAFLHNFQIMGEDGHTPVIYAPVLFFALYLPIIISAFLLVTHIIRKKTAEFVDWVFISILVVNALNLWVANRFQHYFLVFVPVYIHFIHRYFVFEKRSLAKILILICTAFQLLYGGYFFGSYVNAHLNGKAQARYESVSADMARIPEQEQDSVIGFMTRTEYYLFGDIVPCHKYYTLQEGWARINPQILVDFMDYLRSDSRPLWLFTDPTETNPVLLEILSEHYTLQFESEYLVFYRAK
jgi:hypothetical protein